VDITIDLRVIAFAMGVTIASGLFFGLAPALHASRPDLMPALKGTGTSQRPRRFGARNLFVLAQVAGSMVLVVISALFVRDMQQADALDMGFDTRNIGVLSLDLSLRDYDEQTGRRFLETLSERLREIPEVEAVATSGWVPLSGRWWNWGGFQPEGYELDPDQSPRAMWNVVSPGYFQLIGMPLTGGRDFSAADNTEAPDAIIVNQAFAGLYWPNQEPVGKRVILEEGDSPAEVVGVVRDAKYGKADFVDRSSRPHFWSTSAQRFFPYVELHFKARGDPAALFRTVRQQVRTLDSDLPIRDLKRMDSITATALLEERVAALMLAGFGAVSLFLAILGIYGVLAYGIMQRMRELGIRLALGARPTRVIAMVVKESLVMSAAGIFVGLALAALIAQGLRTLLLGIASLDPISYGGSVAVLVLAAIVASAVPALRAARVDPVRSLRSE
jgi:predicted permease